MKKFFPAKVMIFIYLLLAILTTFYIYSMSQNSLMYGDDLRFHLSRAYEIAQNNGQFSYINTHTFGSLGNMITAFYPSFLLYPLAFGLWLTHDFVLSTYLFLGIVNFITLLIADYSFRRAFDGKKWRNLGAITFATLYYFANYRMNNIYIRFDLGELLAQAFLPAVIGGLVLFLTNKSKSRRINWLLVFGFTGVAFSHLLSIILVVITLFILLTAQFCHLVYQHQKGKIKESKLRNFVITIAKNTGLLLLLTSVTWLPLISHMLVLRDTLTMSFDQGEVYKSLDIISFAQRNLDGSYFYNGWLLILLLLIPLLILFKKQLPFWAKSFSLFSLMMLLVQTTLLPIDKIIPILAKKLQFSWRFNELYFIMVIWLTCWFIFSYIPQSNLGQYWYGFKKREFFYTATVLLLAFTSVNVINHWYSVSENYAQTLSKPTSMRKKLDNSNLAQELAVQPYVLDYLPKRTKTVINDLKKQMVIGTQETKLSQTHHTDYTTTLTRQPNELIFNLDGDRPQVEYLFLPVIAYNHNYRISVNHQEVSFDISQEHVPYIKNPTDKTIEISIKYVPAWYDFLGQLTFLITIMGIVIFKTKTYLNKKTL
ncbi:DUF6541 family protein [Holzapfeliella sp. He02]|uniref:DUF6541 family protein n=1 Tax=Holzapfeliella saturejae TaxID=3082953 RepID=A0ABU8SHN4_9LACO